MKKQIMMGIMLLVLAGTAAVGQQNDRDQARRVRTPMGGRSNWLGRRVMTPEFLEKIGVQGEQAAKLKAALDALEKQSQKIEEDITKAALEQAEIAKKVLSEPGASDEELMHYVERIGKMRTEQAKLATKRLVVIRDNLTTEQREKAAAMIGEEQKKWHEEREAREKNNQPNRPATPKGW